MKIINDLPLSLYDVKQKELIGSFKTATHCAKYIFGALHTSKLTERVGASRRTKGRINYNGMTYTVRTANAEQISLLGNDAYFIMGGHREPGITDMMGFYSDKLELKAESNIRTSIYLKEQKRIKQDSAILKQ